MTKNWPKTGHSTRRGNRPSPYLKYGKQPYSYASMYRRVLEHEPHSDFAHHLQYGPKKEH